MCGACAQSCKDPLCSCQVALGTLDIRLRSTSRRKKPQLRRKAVCESSGRTSSTGNSLQKWPKLFWKSKSGSWSPSFSACWWSSQPWSPAQWQPSVWRQSSRASALLSGCWFSVFAPAVESLDLVLLQEAVTWPRSCRTRSRLPDPSCKDIRRRESMQKMTTGEIWRSASACAALRWFSSAAWWPWPWPSIKTATAQCRVSFGAWWPCWCAAVLSSGGGKWRMGVGERRLETLWSVPCFSPSFGQLFSFTNVAFTKASRSLSWNRPRSRWTRQSTPRMNAQLSSKATCSQSERPCARGLGNMPQPGMDWLLAADKTTSVRLWCFCPKGPNTLGFTIQFLRSLLSKTCRTCMATAGALRSMANRSHGAADGGPNGSPTSSWRFHKSAPL